MEATCVGLWNELYPERYQVDAPLFSFNTTESGLMLSEACTFTEDGFLVVKSSRFGRGDTAHISAMAFRTESEWDRAMALAESATAALGFSRIQFGGELRHFFPGVPTDLPRLQSVLVRAGFVEEGKHVYDLERDLADYQPPVRPAETTRICLAVARDAIDSFLASEFPGRWRADVMEKFDEDPSRVIALWRGFELKGFAMVQVDGDVHRRAGAVWSRSLGPGWAALGPIGVAKDLRGQGFGHGLLAAALCRLSSLGARRTIIDWTTLTQFYGKHGFVPTREYVSYAKTL
jgi:GNAT superfamily N-acetyltransferase